MPTSAQLTLLIFAIALFFLGGTASAARLWWDRNGLRVLAKACMYLGLLASALVLAWHSQVRGNWIPVGDNFDALIWLALLLGIFVMYVQRRHPLPGLDWFVMPVVILLLIGAAVFGRIEYHPYVSSAWHWVHRVTSYAGAVAFAIAAVGGGMYLLQHRRLRNKAAIHGMNYGSLERLERITFAAVTLGFALLSIGLLTGLARVFEPGGTTLGPRWFISPKVLLAFAVWIVYALVLHSPINPSFRGRRTAMLSIVGFVLMIAALIVVQYMPTAVE